MTTLASADQEMEIDGFPLKGDVHDVVPHLVTRRTHRSVTVQVQNMIQTLKDAPKFTFQAYLFAAVGVINCVAMIYMAYKSQLQAEAFQSSQGQRPTEQCAANQAAVQVLSLALASILCWKLWLAAVQSCFPESVCALRRCKAASPTFDDDIRACRQILGRGSKTFSMACELLPECLAVPTAAVYSLCRVLDDAADDTSPQDKNVISRLVNRLDVIYSCERDRRCCLSPVDRAVGLVIEEWNIPRGLWDALIDGFKMDREGIDVPDEIMLRTYSSRVAATVGCIMCCIFHVRRRDALHRACDLGMGMQITNICRDVGEDAQRNRCYLPSTLLACEGISPQDLLEAPHKYEKEIGCVVQKLLAQADVFYQRSKSGVGALPWPARIAVAAAADMYQSIGHKLLNAGAGSCVHVRTRVSGRQKAVIAFKAALKECWHSGLVGLEATCDECLFLVDTTEGDLEESCDVIHSNQCPHQFSLL